LQIVILLSPHQWQIAGERGGKEISGRIGKRYTLQEPETSGRGSNPSIEVRHDPSLMQAKRSSLLFANNQEPTPSAPHAPLPITAGRGWLP
jgi:hypothetical protein